MASRSTLNLSAYLIHRTLPLRPGLFPLMTRLVRLILHTNIFFPRFPHFLSQSEKPCLTPSTISCLSSALLFSILLHPPPPPHIINSVLHFILDLTFLLLYLSPPPALRILADLLGRSTTANFHLTSPTYPRPPSTNNNLLASMTHTPQ